MKIKGVLITHLHGDHFLGLPGLVQTMALNDRKEELSIWGPVGTSSSWDMARRMCPFKEIFKVRVFELAGGEEFAFHGMRIRCTRVEHSVPTLAYRIQEKDRPGKFHRDRAVALGIPEGPLWGRLQKGEVVKIDRDGCLIEVGPDQVMDLPRKGASVVFSGDTSPTDRLAELARGADILIHEATFTSELGDLAGEFFHSTVKQAAGIASKAGVKKLVLVHSSPRYTKEEFFNRYLEEALTSFKDVLVPEDLETLDVIP